MVIPLVDNSHYILDTHDISKQRKIFLVSLTMFMGKPKGIK